MNRPIAELFVGIFVIGVVLNLVWEMAQSMLFAPMGSWIDGTWRCLVASLGDGLLVLSIAGAGWLIFRRADWFVHPGLDGYTLMAALGVAIAILVERWALATGRWAYTAHMWVIPFVHVGVAPVLQMVIVPPFVLTMSARWWEPRYGKTVSR